MNGGCDGGEHDIIDGPCIHFLMMGNNFPSKLANESIRMTLSLCSRGSMAKGDDGQCRVRFLCPFSGAACSTEVSQHTMLS